MTGKKLIEIIIKPVNHLKPVVLLSLISIFMCTGSLIAQQEPQFTLNMFNHMAVNPGYAGLRDAITVTGIMRQQWIGIKDDEAQGITRKYCCIGRLSGAFIKRWGSSYHYAGQNRLL